VIFVDSWVWIALASKEDQYHEIAMRQHLRLKKKLCPYVTSDFVLSEVMTYLYAEQAAGQSQRYLIALFAAIDRGFHRLIHLSADHFRQAWQMRQKYPDKLDISFVDFTSIVVMQELGIQVVFTNDAHFRYVGLGFQLVP
jgi:predicted nucleic acid-binding protein